MSNTGSFLHLDSLGLNREERRKLERVKKKERQKNKGALGMGTSVDNVLKQMSTNRKKNSRRK